MMRAMMLRVTAALLAAAVPAAAFSELSGIKEGDKVAGYAVDSLYLDTEDQPMGARFTHSNGMAVDVLRFASVPQISLNVGSLPVSDRGEPHTQEHLLLGKGKVGQYMNSLMSMSLGDHTAATYAELTNYQFNTAADKEAFYGLLKGYLEALVRPDYTDEEIRREVAHLGVEKDPATGVLRLEEKGTVYNEMVSSMEKGDTVNWYQMIPLLFGRDNPLSRNQGGAPKDIRTMGAGDIRRYHGANYHFGSNFRLIAALPPDYSPKEFLERLSAIVAHIEPAAVSALPGCRPGSGGTTGTPCDAYPALAPFAPAGGAPIVIGAFPSEDANLPQSATFAWKPLAGPATPKDELELKLFLSVLAGGDTSLLYEDLIEEKSRTVASGATNVGSYFEEDPANAPMVFVSGLPPASLTEAKLSELRSALLARVEAVGKAGPRSELLKSVNAKALSLLSSWRRTMLKFVDAPPGFGFRHSGIQWHRHLDALARVPGWRKRLTVPEAFDAVERELKSGKNFWKDAIARHGLGAKPLISAVRPDKALLEAERAEKSARLAAELARIREKLGAKDDQNALGLFSEAFAADTGVLAERDKSIARPEFVKNPPLTLDETVDWEEGKIAEEVPLVTSRFPSTPFTDIALAFDARGTGPEDFAYLPVVMELLTELGAATASGEKLDYVKMQERWRSEIYGLGADFSTDARTGRVQLVVSASGASPAENRKAVEWLRTCIERADVSAATAPRLRTVVREKIRNLRQIFQQSEESWVREAARAYEHQRDPRWMSLESPFTRLAHLNRIFFRLGGYPNATARRLSETVLDDLAAGAKQEPRERMAERVKRLASGAGLPAANPATPFLKEFGEYFEAELPRLPEESWRRDMERLIRQTKADLARDPAAEMSRMKALSARLMTRANARVYLTGSPKNTREILPELEALLESLPAGAARAAPPPAQEPFVLARLKERLGALEKPPVHVGLVNNDTNSGVFVLTARGPAYGDSDAESALDFLAGQVFSGAGPHTFFLKTWGAGLAYSNGVRPSAASGRIQYYAERCPELTATMRFVTGLAEGTKIDDRFFVDFALANAFGDYRGAQDFSSRGSALATDLSDGRRPDTVRRFKEALLAAARAPRALESVRERLPRVLGSVLVGYGRKVSESPEAVGFVIAPDKLLSGYERMLKETGEADRLVRLYPRDFWPFD